MIITLSHSLIVLHNHVYLPLLSHSFIHPQQIFINETSISYKYNYGAEIYIYNIISAQFLLLPIFTFLIWTRCKLRLQSSNNLILGVAITHIEKARGEYALQKMRTQKYPTRRLSKNLQYYFTNSMCVYVC